MLKYIIKGTTFFLTLTFFMISQSSASTHPEIPSVDDKVHFDLAYYELKQERCMEAFARSDFDMAYTICTPLANLGFKDAQLVTGLLYAYGEGVDKNLHRAKIWLKEALKNGRDDAARALSEFGME